MAFTKQDESDRCIIRYYTVEYIKNIEDAVKWISDARYIPGMSIYERIYLKDSFSGIWDNESTVVEVDISYEELLSEVKERYIDRIFWWGHYYNADVCIEIEIFKKYERILTKKKNPADIESLEKALNLV